MNTKNHWEHIYETKAPTQVSWYQEHAQFSLQYIINLVFKKQTLSLMSGEVPRL